MKKFMGEDFLLNNPAAIELFAAANEMPILTGTVTFHQKRSTKTNSLPILHG